jgi:hypothetical protein
MTKDEALKLALEALKANVIGTSGRMPKTHEAITAIKEALMSVPDGAQPEQETQGYREAAQLAKWLFKTHYAQQEHYASGRVIWGLCDTTAGVISQIDNMVCKLVLPKEPEKEPVAFENWHKANYVQNLEKYGDTYKNNHVRCRHQGWLGAQSITPPRTWVGLTDEEIAEVAVKSQEGISPRDDTLRFAIAIEAKLKEKNT